MKLRDTAIRLTLDEWIDATPKQFGAYIGRYWAMTYWYGRSIYVVIVSGVPVGVSFAARNISIGLPSFWPDPHKLSVARLQELDASIAIARHDEIIPILLAFQKEVQ